MRTALSTKVYQIQGFFPMVKRQIVVSVGAAILPAALSVPAFASVLPARRVQVMLPPVLSLWPFRQRCSSRLLTVWQPTLRLLSRLALRYLQSFWV